MRIFAYLALVGVLTAGARALSTSTWTTDANVHSVLEATATLLALFAATMAFVRFFTRPSNKFLFIATAFLGTALLDGNHAVITTPYVANLLPSQLDPLIPWSWLASRTFLAVFLWLGLLAWRRELRLGSDGVLRYRTIILSAAGLTLASYLFFLFVRLPDAYYGFIAPRPQEFVPALFFLLAAAGYVRKGPQWLDPFENYLVLSLIVGFLSEAAYMAFAAANYDAMFDAAHVLKATSYVLVVAGLTTEMFEVYRRDQQHAVEMQHINAQLSHEIEERERAEHEREALEDQLREAHKLEAVGQLAGGIAHDFNNVLTAITGYVQLGLHQLKGKGPLADDLRNVVECTQRGSNLVQQLIAFSRLQALQHTTFGLNALLDRSVALIEPLVGEHIELRIVKGADLPDVEADAHQIEQALLNLVANARDAMPGGGVVTIETSAVELRLRDARRLGGLDAGMHVILEVSDDGAGMDEYTRERAFEPFFTTKEVGTGSGLGLATTYGIVKQHRGAIVLESGAGEGTAIRIYLPAASGAPSVLRATAGVGDATYAGRESAPDASTGVVAAPTAAAAAQGPTSTAGPNGRETVLLVEDEEMIRDVSTRFFEERGYTVLAAAHTDEAERLYAAHASAIDILVTDMQLPGCSGRELYERLSRHTPDLKVLFMSGYVDGIAADGDVAAASETFIQKPFAPPDLLARVRAILDD